VDFFAGTSGCLRHLLLSFPIFLSAIFLSFRFLASFSVAAFRPALQQLNMLASHEEFFATM
jgi:hypothetical protein